MVEAEAFAAPGDGVGGVAPGPEDEAEGVAEWEQQQIAEDLAVAKEADADDERDGDACEQSDGEEGEAPEFAAGSHHGQNRPGEDVGDAEAEVAGAARVACGTRPAELVVAEAAECVGRDGGGDDLVEELDAVAGAMEAGAEFVVVGELVG